MSIQEEESKTVSKYHIQLGNYVLNIEIRCENCQSLQACRGEEREEVEWGRGGGGSGLDRIPMSSASMTRSAIAISQFFFFHRVSLLKAKARTSMAECCMARLMP